MPVSLGRYPGGSFVKAFVLAYKSAWQTPLGYYFISLPAAVAARHRDSRKWRNLSSGLAGNLNALC